MFIYRQTEREREREREMWKDLAPIVFQDLMTIFLKE
jgi:hypothetical protein